MATWTPSDLTNPSFVQSQLSAKDRSTALYSVNNELTSAKASLQSAASALTAAQDAANNGPGRGEINALKAKSNDPTLPPAEREQAAQQAADLADQRDKLNVAAENALQKLNNANQYYDNLDQGKNNLLAAGAVEPGVNLFAAPAGYDGRSDPAAQVPDSQNPNPTPTTTAEELESASPELIDPTQDPGANFATGEEEVTGFEPLQEPPGTNDGDEFAGIDEQVAANENTLQEPPQLSEEEVDAYLQTAGQEPDVQESVFDPTGNEGAPQGLTGPKTNTQSQATQQDTDNFYQTGDWRVRLSLAQGADYLYKAKGNEGILLPLAATDGVLFPYTPSVSVQYAAHYDPSDITHSNYKTFQYKSSSVDSFTIGCDFTAQDTFEANYLLAVIHFFRSVTKMFYGQDENPKNGTPPPLCYLSGFGAFQFDRHPLAITGFTYTLPTDVDYIRATNTTTTGGVNKSPANTPVNTTDVSSQRLGSLPVGGGSGPINWQNTKSGSREPTYVPTKMQIQITAVPIVTRNDISRNFSLRDYATGDLLRGSKRKQGGGGIW
jgi:hypothetical protein